MANRYTPHVEVTKFSPNKSSREGAHPLLIVIHATVSHNVHGLGDLQNIANLFANPGFTSHIVGLQRSESDALLSFLYDHAVQPQFTVRYHWHEGDIGFWDNRTTQHSVVGDFGEQHRVIQRVTLRGDEPR